MALRSSFSAEGELVDRLRERLSGVCAGCPTDHFVDRVRRLAAIGVSASLSKRPMTSRLASLLTCVARLAATAPPV